MNKTRTKPVHGEQSFDRMNTRSDCQTMRLAYVSVLLLIGCSSMLFVGCAGYQLGNDTLFNTCIHTVYVPMVKSDVNRRYLSERLTEALCKQIEKTTPYKVVRDSRADAVLDVELVTYSQRITITDKWGGPRGESTQMKVRVKWLNRRLPMQSPASEFTLGPREYAILGDGELIAVAGQSTATQQQEAIDQIAKNIVGILEKPW